MQRPGARLEVAHAMEFYGIRTMPLLRRPSLSLFATALLALGLSTGALAETLRVAIIGNVAPLSYVDDKGKPSGFAVELAGAICDTIGADCSFHVVTLDRVIDSLASHEHDFASVNLLVTPERQRKVVFSKPFYRSVSVWLAKPSVTPGTRGITVGAVGGSAQARFAEQQGWKLHPVATHLDLPAALSSGKVDAALLPMASSVLLMQHEVIGRLGLQTSVITDPAVAGDVALSIAPQRADLRPRIDAAIDRIKADGRFDRINSKYLPFRLQ